MNYFLYLCGSLGVLCRFVNENNSAPIPKMFIENLYRSWTDNLEKLTRAS